MRPFKRAWGNCLVFAWLASQLPAPLACYHKEEMFGECTVRYSGEMFGECTVRNSGEMFGECTVRNAGEMFGECTVRY